MVHQDRLEVQDLLVRLASLDLQGLPEVLEVLDQLGHRDLEARVVRLVQLETKVRLVQMV